MKSQSSNKSFGLLFFIFFLILGLWPLKNSGDLNYYLVVISFVVLTPISLIVRIFGKDLLELKFLKKKETYWIKRKKNLGLMKKQF